MITFCSGEKQTSVYNLIFWKEVKRFSSHGRPSRCIVHVRKPEVVNTVSMLISLCFLETIYEKLLKRGIIYCFNQNIGPYIRKQASFCRQIISLLWKAKTSRFPSWEFILCHFITQPCFQNRFIKPTALFSLYAKLFFNTTSFFLLGYACIYLVEN